MAKSKKSHFDMMNTVAILGLGFVGTAMAAAVSLAKGDDGANLYRIVGIDQDNCDGLEKIRKINSGVSPIVSEDKSLDDAILKANSSGLLTATTDLDSLNAADIVIVDINLDVKNLYSQNSTNYVLEENRFIEAIESIALRIMPTTLVLIETTVPPGFTEKKILPLFQKVFEQRNIDIGQIRLAHSYERVTPGRNYLGSIINQHRVYSGINYRSAELARDFLESIINTELYPLTQLQTPTSSEIAKVLENSYRAANIAFIKEWTEFAEVAGVNLFEILDAIRQRSTHNNIMNPGFGVGGYCLTKDGILADWGAKELFSFDLSMDCSVRAIQINNSMPQYAFNLMQKHSSKINKKKVVLFGLSYIEDVSDTRSSASIEFLRLCGETVADISVHDPYVKSCPELNIEVTKTIDHLPGDLNIIVFAVKHSEYRNHDPLDLIAKFKDLVLVVDGNDVLSDDQASIYRSSGVTVVGVGKGHWTNN